MTKYHNNDNGDPGPCNAQNGNCPFGDSETDHYDSPEEARKAFEEKQSSGLISTNTKNKYFNTMNNSITNMLNSAPTYKKKATVTMRVAKKGEKLETQLKNGQIETTRILDGGECIVKNPDGEEYAMSKDKFLSRYRDNNGVWEATGEIKAIKNPTGKNITIIAPWGEEQHGDKNCYIAHTLDDPNDRYIIGHDEFHNTYVVKGEQTHTNSNNSNISVIGHVKPFAGGRYYGTHVNNNSVENSRKFLEQHVGKDKLAIMEENKRQRDRGDVYHMTVITPPELKELKKNNINVNDFPKNVTINYEGVGRAIDGDNEAYFIVCNSPEIEKWRADNNMPKKDLHITLGFINKDVHTKPKDSSTII